MKQKNILVTGGAGFIGANLVRMLLEQDYAVTVLDNLSVIPPKYLAGLPIRFVEGDILDSERLNQVIPGHKMVVHLAAQTGVPGSLANPQRDCEINVIGTLNMLEACRHADVKRFIFASSNAPLGRQPPPATEDKAPLPISPYGASKLAGEGYSLAYHGSWGLGTVVLRFANIYGPFCEHKNSVVAKFIKDILAEGQITIDGDGAQTRDFIYVEDLCRAILLALESDVGGEVFQIATGVETSILELAELVQEVMGSQISIQHGPSRQGDIRKNYSDISKVERVLGWRPETDLWKGLQQTRESFWD
jgi:UDP-glucose 4-epimerase